MVASKSRRLPGTDRMNAKALFDAVNYPTAIGFACILAWLPQFMNMMNAAGALHNFTYRTNYFHSGTLFLISVVLLSYASLSPKVRKRLEGGTYDVPLACMLTVVSIGAPMLFGMGGVPLEEFGPALAACVAFVSVPVALVYTRWGFALGKLNSLQSFMSLLISYALDEAVITVLGTQSKEVLVVIVSVLPIISCWCLRKGDLCSFGEPAALTKGTATPWTKSFFVKFGICLVLMTSVSMVVHHYCLGDPIIYDAIAYSAVPQLLSAFFTILIIMVYGVLLSLRREHFDFRTVYGMTFLVLITSALDLPFAVSGFAPALPYILQKVADQAFCLLFWFVFAAMCRSGNVLGYRFFPVMLGCRFLGTFIGTFAGPELASFDHREMAYFLAAGGTLVAAFVYTFVFNEENALSVGRVIELSVPSPFKEKCRLTGEIYGLSPREREVLFLIATGHDGPAICEKLFISAGTVSTHRMHIYQKLGVHSKRELIDLIEGHLVESA